MEEVTQGSYFLPDPGGAENTRMRSAQESLNGI